MLKEALSELDREMNHNREILKGIRDAFVNLANSEPDDFKRVTEDALAKHAEMATAILDKIQYLFISNVGFKLQIDATQQAILDLPGVVDNPTLATAIQKKFMDATSEL
jgi:hypothetical protein